MEQTLTIEALSYGSAGIAHAGDGKTIFVKQGVPGDVVRVAIDEDKPRFARGHILEVLQDGPARIQTPCPYATACGGCPWQHIAYETQLEAKRENITAQLVRIGGINSKQADNLVEACRASKQQMSYRNKIEMAVGRDKAGRLALGFRRQDSHELIAVDRCPLATRHLERAPKALRGALRFLAGGNEHTTDDNPLGLYRVGVRSSERTGSTEIALWTKPGVFPRAAAARTLSSTLKATSIVRVLAYEGKQRSIKGVEVLAGKGFWQETLAEFTYRISAPSFFQVNTAQAEQLISLVIEGLDITETSHVADLYSGAGTFTLPLADRAGEVIAVESASSSVRDLRRNAETAGVWVDVRGGDSARELAHMGHLDALVVDPPRAGLTEAAIAGIAQAQPARLAYVSCEPATWARDVARLADYGYTLTRVTPVDLFPQTYHCELVSIFSR